MIKKIKIGFKKIPIAWLLLQYQKTQTLAAILGITFTVGLLFMQLGFRSAFLDGFVTFPASLQGDIFIVSSWSPNFLNLVSFSSRRLYQALKFPEVESVTPIYINSTLWRNTQDKTVFDTGVLTIGFPIKSQIINLPGIEENLDKLKLENHALFDEKSHPKFNVVIEEFKNKGIVISEIKTSIGNYKNIEIRGLFQLGANISFGSHLLVSESTFFNFFNRNKAQIDLGIIKLHPNADVETVVSQMNSYFPEDIKIYSKENYLQQEKAFQEDKTPIGIIFRFGLIGATIVGIIILYQILYVKISKHIHDYATLKAIGYPHVALVKIVLEEAFMLTILGYIPGFIISRFMYDLLAKSTGMLVVIKLNIAVLVFLITCLISFASAGIAVWKLKEADPADIFV